MTKIDIIEKCMKIDESCSPKICGLKNYEFFKEHFPHGRGIICVRNDSNTEGYTPMRYSYDPDGIDFAYEDKNENIDGLTLEWEQDIQYVAFFDLFYNASFIRVCTTKGKYLDIIANN